jgi:hypothetical protein
MRFVLATLEQHYGRPVDIEFAVQEIDSRHGPRIMLSLLQCRPLIHQQDGRPVSIPKSIPERHKLFSANRLVPQGLVSGVRYIVWIDPAAYDQIADPVEKAQVARIVGRLNQALKGERFILMGPGRWGSSNLNLGVKVSYADINHASVLVEVALAHGEHAPEASYGTHFFQDLVESQIYPLPIYPDDPETIFNWDFFNGAPSALGRLLPDCAGCEHIKVIDVPETSEGQRLEIVMDGERDRALGYLK